MRRRAAALLALTLLAGGCADRREDRRAARVTSSPAVSASPEDTPGVSPVPEAASPTVRPPAASRRATAPAVTARPTAVPGPNLADVRITTTRVVSLSQPLASDLLEGRLYIAEKGGRIKLLDAGSTQTVLDISSEVSTGSEQGLLGMAFSPDANFLYVHFTDRSGDTRLREYAVTNGRPETGTARQLLTVDQPFGNHNGGQLAFGPDGRLYLALGDGGSGGDPQGNGQSLRTLLGKVLRIDPRPSGGQPYAVPGDNPFVGRSDARPEIWAYGLRNPWRFSFDRATGDLWIGDVGQNAWEEIDLQGASSRGGENYGWDRMEGTHRFEGSEPAGHVPPVYEYANGGGACSVTGGYVYRGTRIPALAGAYVFADFCEGRLRAIDVRGGRTVEHRFLGPDVDNVSSFAQDASGELYVLSLDGGVFRIDLA